MILLTYVLPRLWNLMSAWACFPWMLVVISVTIALTLHAIFKMDIFHITLNKFSPIQYTASSNGADDLSPASYPQVALAVPMTFVLGRLIRIRQTITHFTTNRTILDENTLKGIFLKNIEILMILIFSINSLACVLGHLATANGRERVWVTRGHHTRRSYLQQPFSSRYIIALHTATNVLLNGKSLSSQC